MADVCQKRFFFFRSVILFARDRARIIKKKEKENDTNKLKAKLTDSTLKSAIMQNLSGSKNGASFESSCIERESLPN